MTARRAQEFDAVWAWRYSPPVSILAACAVVLALAGLAMPATSLLGALLAPTPAALEAKSEEKRQAEQQAGVFAGYVTQIDGRSLFIVPAPPSTEVAEETPEETIPTAPTRYGGPGVIAAINGAVWFSDGTRRVVGEAEKDGLAVVSVNAPWDIGVRWRGVEFTVPVFERDRTVMPRREGVTPPEVPPPPPESIEEVAAEADEDPAPPTNEPPTQEPPGAAEPGPPPRARG